jgi:WD repeat-containing protein 19
VIEKHNVECFAGIARTSIKLGDIQRGFNIARDIKDKSLLTDIAVVCENLKQYLEAAQIYEKAENYEKAATLYLQLKMFKQAAPIMDKVTSKSIQIKYGKAK